MMAYKNKNIFMLFVFSHILYLLGCFLKIMLGIGFVNQLVMLQNSAPAADVTMSFELYFISKQLIDKVFKSMQLNKCRISYLETPTIKLG